MHRTLLTCIVLLSLLRFVAADPAAKRFLYLSTPDGAQLDSGSGNGILLFDIDHEHQFVRRIEVPVFKEVLRGFCGNAKRHCVYYSTTNGRLGCFDLETEKVVWEKVYPLGCDRSSITLEGDRLFVPTGWWRRGDQSGLLVVNADNGQMLKHLRVYEQAHNSVVSLDGKWLLLGSETNLTVFRTTDQSVVRTIRGVGEVGVFPFTIDSRNQFAYVCLGQHVGFDIVNLQTGEIPHRVLAGETPIAHRTHGAALTPDERELWISDQDGKKLFVFDMQSTPPKPKAQLPLSAGGHGWVCFSLDGQFAWCHTPDVFDARTKKQVATLKDDKGKPVGGSKFLEVHFREGKVTVVGNEFGLGRALSP